MLNHGAVPYKGVVAAGTNAVVMPIDAVVVAVWSPAVNGALKELIALQNGDIVVIVLGVQQQKIELVCRHVTKLTAAVIVILAQEYANGVWTFLRSKNLFESIDDPAVFVALVVHERQCRV